jgi:hypothetical protein
MGMDMKNKTAARSAAPEPDPWRECITHCWTCRTECQKTFYEHCLVAGGEHVEQDHVRIMMDCIDICQTAADSMTRLSPAYAALCAACASVCEACADSCDTLENETMRQLAAVCRACAASCRGMSLGGEGEPAITLSPYSGPESGTRQ